MLKTEYFIAERLFFSQAHDAERRMSRPAVKVALGAIIVGIAVMIVTIFVIIGFKNEVSQKVVGFQSHLRVVSFENNNTYELSPIYYDSALLSRIEHIDGVEKATPFITKPAIIKTKDNFHGIIVKGMDMTDGSMLKVKGSISHDATSPYAVTFPHESGWGFFLRHITLGRLPEKSNEVIVSEMIANKLELSIDSSFLCYFIGDDIRVRKYTIIGVYNTGFAEADDMFVMTDISSLRQLNQWSETEASGIDVVIDDFHRINEVYDNVYFSIANRFDDKGKGYFVENIVDENPNIFKWLDLLDKNVLIIIFLMLAVSIVNIITALIIIIMDSIQLIGTLKALGADNRFVQRIFLLQATFLVVKGLLWGNVIALVLCVLQYFFHLIPLDSQSYYVSYVPIAFHWGWWALLNIGTLFVTMLTLLFPATILTKISPAEVMRYE